MLQAAILRNVLCFWGLCSSNPLNIYKHSRLNEWAVVNNELESVWLKFCHGILQGKFPNRSHSSSRCSGQAWSRPLPCYTSADLQFEPYFSMFHSALNFMALNATAPKYASIYSEQAVGCCVMYSILSI
jgi:hypothetical protein